MTFQPALSHKVTKVKCQPLAQELKAFATVGLCDFLQYRVTPGRLWRDEQKLAGHTESAAFKGMFNKTGNGFYHSILNSPSCKSLAEFCG